MPKRQHRNIITNGNINNEPFQLKALKINKK